MLTRQKQTEYKEQGQVTVRKEAAGQNWSPYSPLLSFFKNEGRTWLKEKGNNPKTELKTKHSSGNPVSLEESHQPS